MSAIRSTVVCVLFSFFFSNFFKGYPTQKVLNNLALLCQGGEKNYNGKIIIIIIIIINPNLRTFFAKRSVSLL